jgi:Thymosin beta-4 family
LAGNIWQIRSVVFVVRLIKMCVWMASDVQQEKQHNELIQGVEGFNHEALRKTETLEKVILPNAEGNRMNEAKSKQSRNATALLDDADLTRLSAISFSSDTGGDQGLA